jgi:hypothetical protein
MKNYFFDLLDQVTPRNEEDKDILMCFLGFFPLVLSAIGGFLLTLILMR